VGWQSRKNGGYRQDSRGGLQRGRQSDKRAQDGGEDRIAQEMPLSTKKLKNTIRTSGRYPLRGGRISNEAQKNGIFGDIFSALHHDTGGDTLRKVLQFAFSVLPGLSGPLYHGSGARKQ